MSTAPPGLTPPIANTPPAIEAPRVEEIPEDLGIGGVEVEEIEYPEIGTREELEAEAEAINREEERAHRGTIYTITGARTASTANELEGLNWSEIPAETNDIDSSYRYVTAAVLTDESAWEEAGICATELTAGYSLNEMLKDINGSTGYSEDKAALGTVTSHLFLQVTPGLVIPDGFVIGANPFLHDGIDIASQEYQQRVANFLVANHAAMMAANVGLNSDQATFLALIRLNVVIAGGVANSMMTRAIYVNEYASNNHVATVAELVALGITKVSATFVADYWLQMVMLLRHIFITRGHHYKDEYQDVIDRTWAATTIETPAGMTLPSWRHILRTALHCFGIRFMNLLAVEGRRDSKIAQSFVTRFGAAPAGTAPIRTGYATLQSMKQAHWYHQFESAFLTQIRELEDAYDAVRRAGLRAHVNAKLFNFAWISLRVSDAPVRPLAPYFLAYIDSLERGESLKGQRALTKRGDGGSAIRAAFTNVLMNDSRNSSMLTSATGYFASLRAIEGNRADRGGRTALI